MKVIGKLGISEIFRIKYVKRLSAICYMELSTDKATLGPVFYALIMAKSGTMVKINDIEGSCHQVL